MNITKSNIEITKERREQFFNSTIYHNLRTVDKIESGVSEIDPNNTWYVYVVRNKTNGKIYVGKCKNAMDRANNYIWNYDHRDDRRYSLRPISNAIAKHGIENFEMFPICLVHNFEEVAEKEIEYINYFESANPSKGYNVSTTKDTCTNFKRINPHQHTIDTKMKKSYIMICINPQSKVLFISVGMKLFGDYVGTSKDIVKNCARKQCKHRGFWIIYLSNERRAEILDKHFERIPKLRKAIDHESSKEYIHYVNLVDKFTQNYDIDIFEDYDCYYLSYNDSTSPDSPSYKVEPIEEFYKLL